MPEPLPEITVAAGVLCDGGGRVLIAQRPEGLHQAGWWEFPGGKLTEGESPADGLRRELAEELGITVLRAEALIDYAHSYPDRRVNLHVWLVIDYAGDPVGAEGQALRWVAVENLMDAGLLPADEPIIRAVRALTDR